MKQIFKTDTLYQLFKVPGPWGDEDSWRRAEVLHIAHLFIFIGCLFYMFMPSSVLNGQAIFVAATIVIAGIGSLLLRLGKLQWSALWTTGIIWLTFTAGSATEGGIESTSFAGTIAVVVFAGLTYGATASIVISVLSVLAGAVLVYLKQANLLPTQAIAYSPLNMLSDFAVYISITCIFTIVAIRRIERSTAKFESELSERRKIEEILKESEEKFSKAFLDAPLIIGISRMADGRFVDINEQVYESSGYKREEVIGKSSAEIGWLNANDLELVYGQLNTHGRLSDLELNFKKKDGSISICICSGRIIHVNGAPHLLSILQDVTESKKAETAFRESQKQYHLLAENISDIIWLRDQDLGKYVYVSPSVERVRGYSVKEALAQDLDDVVTPESLKVLLERIPERVRALGRGCEGPYVDIIEQLCKDGSTLWTEVLTHYRKNPDNQHVEIFGVTRDITERRATEEALKISEEKFSKAFVSAPVCMSVSEMEGGLLLDVNREFEGLLGYGRDEIIGKTSTEIGLWLNAQEREDVVRVIRESGKAENVEIRMRKKSGELVTLRYSAQPVTLDAKRLLLSTFVDITDRKQREEELLKLRKAVDTSSESIFMTDREGLLTFINPAFTRLYGYTSEEIVGKATPRILKAGKMPPQEYQKFWNTILSGQVSVGEVINRTKDGRLLNVESSVNPVLDDNGIITGFLAIQRDVTERKRGEENRLELERQLLHTQRLESLGVLAGGIAHDFNNLLVAILGHASLVKSRLEPTDKNVTNLERIEKSADRAADLARQMLAYSGKGRFQVSDLKLNALIRENVELFRTGIPKAITLNLELASEEISVRADKGQMQQVVMNLITNASEAIGKNAGAISLTTGLVHLDDEILKQSRLPEKPQAGWYAFLEAKDTGCGMDARIQERMFEPFFTTKFTGRGLGLSAVLGIVKGHKGAILVESESNHGTMIRIFFPSNPAADRDGREEASIPVIPEQTSASTGTVLVVDDEEFVRDLGKELLEELGFQCICACDGEDAVRQFKNNQNQIVCVLLDLTMPKMDGVATFKELRNISPDVRVILSSGYDEQEVTEKFAGAGLSGFVQKPYRFMELKKKLGAVLGS